jgi:hypothetical protein
MWIIIQKVGRLGISHQAFITPELVVLVCVPIVSRTERKASAELLE